jgi:hypothetical protein
LPAFITAPGETDVLMVAMAVFLIIAVLAVGNLFLRLHTLPERMAHRSHKLQFEIVAVLGLIALFTHMHIFWVAGLLLALIDLPDFSTPLRSMAGSLERIAGVEQEARAGEEQDQAAALRDRHDPGDGGAKVPEVPVPDGPRRPQPVPVPTRDKVMADA